MVAGNVKDEPEAVLRDHESTLDIPTLRWRLMPDTHKGKVV